MAGKTRCYNSSWIYLSVDGCSNSSTPSGSSSSSSTDLTAEIPNTSSNRDTNKTGAIVGSAIGGIAGLVAILAAGYFAYRRRRPKIGSVLDRHVAEADASNDTAVSELPPYSQMHELEHPRKFFEAPTGHERLEMEASLGVELEAPSDSNQTHGSRLLT